MGSPNSKDDAEKRTTRLSDGSESFTDTGSSQKTFGFDESGAHARTLLVEDHYAVDHPTSIRKSEGGGDKNVQTQVSTSELEDGSVVTTTVVTTVTRERSSTGELVATTELETTTETVTTDGAKSTSVNTEMSSEVIGSAVVEAVTERADDLEGVQTQVFESQLEDGSVVTKTVRTTRRKVVTGGITNTVVEVQTTTETVTTDGTTSTSVSKETKAETGSCLEPKVEITGGANTMEKTGGNLSVDDTFMESGYERKHSSTYGENSEHYKQWHPQFVSYVDSHGKHLENLSTMDIFECSRAFCRENFSEFHEELFNGTTVEESKACWVMMKQLAVHYPMVAVKLLAQDIGKKSMLILDEIWRDVGMDNRSRKEVAVFMLGHSKTDVCQVFDDLLILQNGEVAYYGSAEGAVEYFHEFGYQCASNHRVSQFLLNLVAEQEAKYRILMPTPANSDGTGGHYANSFAVLLKFADDAVLITGGNNFSHQQTIMDSISNSSQPQFINSKTGQKATVKTEVFHSEEVDGSIVTKTVRTTTRTESTAAGELVTTIEVETTTETEATDGTKGTTVATETHEETITEMSEITTSPTIASTADMTVISSTEEVGTDSGESVKTEVFHSEEVDGSIVTKTVRTTTRTESTAAGELVTTIEVETTTETEATEETTESTKPTETEETTTSTTFTTETEETEETTESTKPTETEETTTSTTFTTETEETEETTESTKPTETEETTTSTTFTTETEETEETTESMETLKEMTTEMSMTTTTRSESATSTVALTSVERDELLTCMTESLSADNKLSASVKDTTSGSKGDKTSTTQTKKTDGVSAMTSYTTDESHQKEGTRAAAAWGEEAVSSQKVSAKAMNVLKCTQELSLRHGHSLRIAFSELSCTVPISESSTIDVIRGVTGYTEAGVMTAVLGATRTGKAAFLGALAGEVTPTNGKIFYNGHEASTRVRRRATGYCWFGDEHVVTHDTTTVREALCLSAYLRQSHQISESRKLETVESCLELLELKDLADKGINACTAIEVRLVAIGMELAFAPSVLLLDEPTNGLDAEETHRIIRVSLIAWSTLTLGASFSLGAIARASHGNAWRENGCWRREQAWQAYPALAYHVCCSVVELLFVLAITFVAGFATFSLFDFWSVATSSNFSLYWFTLAIFALSQLYLGQWLARMASNDGVAAAAGAGINLLPLLMFVWSWRSSVLGSFTWLLVLLTPQRIALQVLQALVFGMTEDSCVTDIGSAGVEGTLAKSEVPCRELRLIPSDGRYFNEPQLLTVHSYAELEYGAERASVAFRLVGLLAFLVAFRFIAIVALQKRARCRQPRE
ncbi:hypothetical protein G195_010289 [Phytophthora kernoviae 00238/432]|uniref:ABC transporter domain-containing protein n=1 Tax=Phytophthora kernoviae 00238/432 TaxID=1284355 RepID=A0A8J4S110_9STRA|nr:hypothetical protein G195_010289 [Phytophthora kernoviae 00238/432]